jgi:hypothetical protein
VIQGTDGSQACRSRETMPCNFASSLSGSSFPKTWAHAKSTWNNTLASLKNSTQDPGARSSTWNICLMVECLVLLWMTIPQTSFFRSSQVRSSAHCWYAMSLASAKRTRSGSVTPQSVGKDPGAHFAMRSKKAEPCSREVMSFAVKKLKCTLALLRGLDFLLPRDAMGSFGEGDWVLPFRDFARGPTAELAADVLDAPSTRRSKAFCSE